MKPIKKENLDNIVHKLSERAIRNRKKKVFSYYFIFKPAAPLKNFLQQKLTKVYDVYTLGGLMIILKKIISDEMMCDQRNPYIILCSPLLEKALNMKAFHVCEMPELLLNQLVCLSEIQQKKYRTHIVEIYQNLPENQQTKYQMYVQKNQNQMEDHKIIQEQETHQSTMKKKEITKIDPEEFKNPTAQFRMSNKLKAVLCAKSELQTFKYLEITAMLSNYLLSRKESIFLDPRNIKIAFIAFDPLSHAFEMNVFHRIQVTGLLRKQLILVKTHQDTSLLRKRLMLVNNS